MEKENKYKTEPNRRPIMFSQDFFESKQKQLAHLANEVNIYNRLLKIYEARGKIVNIECGMPLNYLELFEEDYVSIFTDKAKWNENFDKIRKRLQKKLENINLLK